MLPPLAARMLEISKFARSESSLVCVLRFAAAPELENVTVEPETVVVAITRLLSGASRGRKGFVSSPAGASRPQFRCVCPVGHRALAKREHEAAPKRTFAAGL